MSDCRHGLEESWCGECHPPAVNDVGRVTVGEASDGELYSREQQEELLELPVGMWKSRAIFAKLAQEWERSVEGIYHKYRRLHPEHYSDPYD